MARKKRKHDVDDDDDDTEESAPEKASILGPQPPSILEMLGMLWVRRNIMIAITAVCLLVAAVYNVGATRKYEARAILHIGSQTGQEVEVGEVVDLERMIANHAYTKTLLEILKSRNVREEVVRRYEMTGASDLTVEGGGANKLDGMLKLQQRQDSELVDVTVTDTDPDRAAKLANLVNEVLREQTLESRRDSAREATVWLKRQLSEYRQRIIDETTALMEYQKANDLADAEEAVTQLSSSMSAFNTAYGDIARERALLETTVRSHQNMAARGQWETLGRDMQSALVDQYIAASAERSEVASRYKEGHPDRKVAEEKLANAMRLLQEDVQRTLATERARLATLQATEENLAQESDQAKSLLLERQGLTSQYEQLKLQLERSKAFYATLSQRDGELELASRTQLSNVRVIDDARPNPSPVTPKVGQNFLLALATGLVGGGVAAFLVEFLNDRISTPFDVTTYLRVPFLGIIPRLDPKLDDQKRALHLVNEPNTPAAEAVRALRALLELHPKAESLRRILVTSSQTAEGKTSTVSSLAIAFAGLGRRVLLIDADMRKPKIHRVFGLERTHGLSEVLQGVMPVGDAILTSKVPNLDILPAGPVPSGPNELIASPAMTALLTDLDRRYDIVFIDSPPSGLLSDAALLSKRVDGVVFVIREKRVSRRVASEAVHRLVTVGAPLLGVVVNDVDLVGPSSRYRYHYEYQYQYTEKRPDVAAT